MTDEQVIKALEQCGNIIVSSCKDCPLHEKYNANCVRELTKESLDLINRQQAEIERLKEENRKFERYPVIVGVGNNCLVLTRSLDDYDKFIGDVSAEGIKEFAERLKKKTKYAHQIPAGEYFVAVDEEDIDNLVKELTEEQNNV